MPKRKKVVFLGNCVAQRLQNLLPRYPGFGDGHEIVPAPMIHLLRDEAEWQSAADLALNCDLLCSQPLFNYGPCNTENLRASLREGQSLIVFSSPNFEAYFPDAIVLQGAGAKEKHILDWDSSIIFSCYLRGLSIFAVEEIYRNHPLFCAENLQKRVDAALERYISRERNVDLSTSVYAIRNFARRKLFHTPKHPVDSFLQMMLAQVADCLGLPALAEEAVPVEGFGFNQWPVLTGKHNLFTFPEQSYFVIGGQRVSLEDAAMAYYIFYDANPEIVEANRNQALEI